MQKPDVVKGTKGAAKPAKAAKRKRAAAGVENKPAAKKRTLITDRKGAQARKAAVPTAKEGVKDPEWLTDPSGGEVPPPPSNDNKEAS